MKPSTRMARLTGTAVLTSSALVACAVPMGPLGVVSGEAQPSSNDSTASPQPTTPPEAATAPAAAAEVNTSGERVDRRALARNLRAALERPRVDWTSTSAHHVTRDRWQINRGTVDPTPPPAPAPSPAPVTPTTIGEAPATETAPEVVDTPVPAEEPPAVETPIVDSPSVSTPPVETPVVEAPAEPAPEAPTPVVDVPAAQQPEIQPETAVDPVPAEQPESPVRESPAAEAPAEVPTPEAPNTDGQAPEAPVTESPVTETPTVADPLDTAPIDAAPTESEPSVVEPSVGEQPTDAVPTDGAPVSEVPTVDEPAGETAPPAPTPEPQVPVAQPETDPIQEPVTAPEAQPAPVAQPEPTVQPEPEVQPTPAPESQPVVSPAPEVDPTPAPQPTPTSQPAQPTGTTSGTNTNAGSGTTVPQTQTPVVPVSNTDTTPVSTPETPAPAQTPETATPVQGPETVAPEPAVPEAIEAPAPTESPVPTGAPAPTESTTTNTTNTGSNTPAGRVAYLHGYQQAQAMCPGGSMVGLVDTAIVAPLVASGVLADGDCTLADMKAANPGTEFLAYLNIGGMQAISGWDKAPFYPSCVDPAYGDQYAVTPNNGNVATNSKGYAVYPAFDFITIADQSESYARACGEHAVVMVTTDSVVGTTGAVPVRFDGIFMDDMAMSPAHGQDMAEIGTWGPWGSDDAYGRAILRTVDIIADAMEAAGPDKVLAGNLGIYSDKQNQVALAQELADSGNLDWMMREFVIGSPTGSQFGAFYAVEQNADVLAQLSRSTPVVMHQFAVDATTSPSLTGSIGGQCLVDSTPNTASLMWQVDQRRVQDMTLSLATVLTGKETGTNLDMAIMQAQPDCQETAANGSSAYESVTDVSLDESDPSVAVLRDALSNPDVVAVGEKDTWYEYSVWRRDLSDGRQVWVNYRQEAVVIDGVTIPAQTGIITG